MAGHNCGRNYTMCCEHARDFLRWYDTLDKAIYEAKKVHARMVCIHRRACIRCLVSVALYEVPRFRGALR